LNAEAAYKEIEKDHPCDVVKAMKEATTVEESAEAPAAR
jgi:hypothetical protein